jgi:MFS transporter, DHA2 family, multidrug resistance protein
LGYSLGPGTAGIALSFLFIPLMTLSMARISAEKMRNATSIFNLMRNIGGSIGIAVMTTFLARRTQLHQNHLIANISPGDLKALQLLQGLRANFYAHGADAVTASRKALGAIMAWFSNMPPCSPSSKLSGSWASCSCS